MDRDRQLYRRVLHAGMTDGTIVVVVSVLVVMKCHHKD
jgi:hypothetical protein